MRRLKGPSRPINTLDDRLLVLEALSCVDHVVAFDTDTPEALIEAVGRTSSPRVAITRAGRCRGRARRASRWSVQILPLVDDRSTTGIIRAPGRPSQRPSDEHGSPVEVMPPRHHRGSGHGIKRVLAIRSMLRATC